MSRHATAEVLSSYLDTELSADEVVAVEAHLESCEECRQRLDGLTRVVDRLGALRRAAPPPHLGPLVEQRIRLDADRRGLLQRLEHRVAGRWPIHSPLASVFALVVALAVIVYLFAYGLDRGSQGTRVILNPEVAEESAGREVAGRTFDRVGETWIERGLADEPPTHVVVVQPEGSDGRSAEAAELEPFRALGGPVRLRTAEGVVEARFAEPEP